MQSSWLDFLPFPSTKSLLSSSGWFFFVVVARGLLNVAGVDEGMSGSVFLPLR
jgi:hypothetical protein